MTTANPTMIHVENPYASSRRGPNENVRNPLQLDTLFEFSFRVPNEIIECEKCKCITSTREKEKRVCSYFSTFESWASFGTLSLSDL